jgi:hypothetical protein
MHLFFLTVITMSLGVARAAEPKFTPLFNGRDLAGWDAVTKDPKASAADSWSVLPGGVLRCTGKPTGYLATTAEYGDYVLKLEWMYPVVPGTKRYNGGVLLHVQKEKVFWPHSIEAQLSHGNAGDIWLQYDAAKKLPALAVDPKRKDAANKEGRRFLKLDAGKQYEKPLGEWNSYEIHCTGGAIKLFVNGQLANDATGGDLKRGRIGLQAEGAEVHFRAIELWPMQ